MHIPSIMSKVSLLKFHPERLKHSFYPDVR
jgi:hypothetical protein